MPGAVVAQGWASGFAAVVRRCCRGCVLGRGPVRCVRPVALGDPEACFHRRDGTNVWAERRLLETLRRVQVVDGLLRVTLGIGDSTHGHEPPVAALGH